MSLRKLVVVIAATTLVATLTTLAVAGATLNAGSGGAIGAVRVVSGGGSSGTSSTSYVNLPGASGAITVPPGHHGLILARFTAESFCDNTTDDSGYCSVRIRIDGNDMRPAVGMNFAFDTLVDGTTVTDWWESNSVEHWRVVGPGTHTVRVQFAVTNANVDFELDDWTLVIQRSNKA
jgi:hypothetical protein